MSVLLLHWGSYRWACNLWVLIIYLYFFPVILPSEIPRLATDPSERVFPGAWKLLSFLRFLGWVSVPPFCLSFYLLCFFPYLLSKTMGCLSGCLMSSASIQKLFCEIYSAFKCSFHEFVGEKVVSPSYSSAILGPPPNLALLKGDLFYIHDYLSRYLKLILCVSELKKYIFMGIFLWLNRKYRM